MHFLSVMPQFSNYYNMGAKNRAFPGKYPAKRAVLP